MIGLDILPIDNEDTKESAALEIDIEFKRLSAIFREELEKLDFSKNERYQKMTVNEILIKLVFNKFFLALIRIFY